MNNIFLIIPIILIIIINVITRVIITLDYIDNAIGFKVIYDCCINEIQYFVKYN